MIWTPVDNVTIALFGLQMIAKIGEFENNPDKERLKFPPMDKIYRAIVYVAASINTSISIICISKKSASLY